MPQVFEQINDPKIVTERLKKDIIKLVIDEVVIEGESVKIFATIPLPNKIHEREMDKTDIPGTFNAGATLGPVNETNMARIWNKHKQINTPLKRKVFVGMSGGVDSSVSAALLKRDGYDVVGVFIKVWQAEFLPCTWREERRDAMRAAAHIGIPLITLDLEKEYKQEVVDYMIREYGAGRVPNPDVMCNKYVKFGAFLNFAKVHGANFVATGHYAQVQKDDGGYHLMAGVDKEKDQTYFLWTLTQEELAHTLFPVGHLQKSEVRMLAKEFGLPNAEKKDSQGLCFMGMIDMKDFLKHYIPAKKGNVLDVQGKIIGSHEGAMLYTIGERHGFKTEKHSVDQAPLFVVSKNLPQNTITVGERAISIAKITHADISLEQVNIISSLGGGNNFPQQSYARIRYRGKLYPATWLDPAKFVLHVTFTDEDEYIAPGQSIVFYDGDECLGGGVICA